MIPGTTYLLAHERLEVLAVDDVSVHYRSGRVTTMTSRESFAALVEGRPCVTIEDRVAAAMAHLDAGEAFVGEVCGG